MLHRDYLSSADFTSEETLALLKLAAKLKRKWRKQQRPSQKLCGQTLAAIFEKPSLRTRTSFEVAMTQLGGHTMVLDDGIGMGQREPVPDVARTLARVSQIIAARTFAHSTVEELARYSDVPVINALSDREHPCQALADLLTIQEHLGRFGGHKVAFIGDGNNVCHSLLLASASAGLSVVVASPEGYWPHTDIVAQAQEIAAEHDATISVTTDKYAAVHAADAIYTDVWASMGQEAEAEQRRAVFMPFQVDADLLHASGNPRTLIMHDLPAHRGEEITADVLDGPNAVAFDQAENRLHVQKALMLMLLGK